MTPDLINGLFEIGGGIFNYTNIRQLLKDKEVKGVKIFPTMFFSIWGFWNLFYYPSLDQWLSFVGGIILVISNAYWVFLAFYYKRLRGYYDHRKR